jgi:hypothetical protein
MYYEPTREAAMTPKRALVLLGQFAAPALAALSPFAGQKVTVATVMGSDDGLGFANDFIEVFRAARWAVDLAFVFFLAHEISPGV